MVSKPFAILVVFNPGLVASPQARNSFSEPSLLQIGIIFDTTSSFSGVLKAVACGSGFALFARAY